MREEIAKNFKGIIDSTLREGLQFAKANFSLEEQIDIFNYLEKIGVDYVEVSNPVKLEIREIIKELVERKNKSSPKILAHIRNREEDIEKAIESKVDGVNILCTADPERISSLKLTPNNYLKNLEKNIILAKSQNLEIRVSAEDFFHQPFELILEIYELASNLNVERIGVPDTLGKALPWDVERRIRELRKRFRIDIEVHFHNDFGNSVSNALSALKAGANWIDTSLLGIGERTGITPLSALLVNLYNIDRDIVKKYNLKFITEAENYVAKVCNVEVPINLITNICNGFAHKAGIHLNALMNFGPHKYEPLPPNLIGNKRKLVIKSIVSGKTDEEDLLNFLRKYGED
jgi:homocitrate synthase